GHSQSGTYLSRHQPREIIKIPRGRFKARHIVKLFSTSWLALKPCPSWGPTYRRHCAKSVWAITRNQRRTAQSASRRRYQLAYYLCLLGLWHFELVKRPLKIVEKGLPLGCSDHQMLVRFFHGTARV